MNPATGGLPPALTGALESLGFRAARDHSFELDEVALVRAGAWILLEDRSVDFGWNGPHSPHQLEERPGPWRILPGASFEQATMVFEIHPGMFGPSTSTETTGTHAWGTVIEWALATRRGSLPTDWSAPTLDQLSSWIPRDDLTVRVGSELRQGSVARTDQRLALEIPLVLSLSDELPGERKIWLDQLLAEAHRSWRLVTIRQAPDGSADAVVDLTGAPPQLLEPLSRSALDALRWVTSWVLPSAALLTDPSVESRILAAAPTPARLVSVP